MQAPTFGAAQDAYSLEQDNQQDDPDDGEDDHLEGLRGDELRDQPPREDGDENEHQQGDDGHAERLVPFTRGRNTENPVPPQGGA